MTRLFFISLEKDRLAGKSEEVVPVEEGKGRRLDGRENRGGERLGGGWRNIGEGRRIRKAEREGIVGVIPFYGSIGPYRIRP